MDDQDTGALNQVANRGAMDDQRQVAYGDSGSPLAAAPGMLNQILSPEHQSSQRDQAYWGGLTDPDNNPGQDIGVGTGNAIRARTAMSLEQDKLKAAYMPLIMQQIVQSQTMALAAAKADRDWRKELVPEFNKHMVGLRTANNIPTRPEAIAHAAKWADAYNLPPGMFTAFAQQIPREPADMKKWLDGLALSTKPEAALPTAGQNAAGQNVGLTPVLGTQSTLQGPSDATSATPGGMGSNPSKVDVEAQGKGLEAYPKTAETMGVEAQTLHDMVSRMTEVRDLQQQVIAGKYAGSMTGLAASMKSIAVRAGMDEKKADELANKIAGAKPGSPNALAAAQSIGAFGLIESMQQLRDANNNKQINRNEFNAFGGKINALEQDPEAFNKMYDYSRQRYANYANKYHEMAEASRADGMTRAPWHNDARYHVSEAQRLGADNPSNSVGTGPVQEPTPVGALGMAGRPKPGEAQATGQPGASGAQTAAGNGPAKASKAPAPIDPRNLTLYERGAVLSPRGVPIIKDPSVPGGYRYARKAQ